MMQILDVLNCLVDDGGPITLNALIPTVYTTRTMGLIRDPSVEQELDYVLQLLDVQEDWKRTKACPIRYTSIGILSSQHFFYLLCLYCFVFFSLYVSIFVASADSYYPCTKTSILQFCFSQPPLKLASSGTTRQKATHLLVFRNDAAASPLGPMGIIHHCM